MPLTQEHLAIMVDKHRNRIGTDALDLKKRGLIDYDRHGRMTILDPKGLEATGLRVLRNY